MLVVVLGFYILWGTFVPISILLLPSAGFGLVFVFRSPTTDKHMSEYHLKPVQSLRQKRHRHHSGVFIINFERD